MATINRKELYKKVWESMIGHSDISMTDRYSHLTVQHNLNTQRQLADHYASKNS